MQTVSLAWRWWLSPWGFSRQHYVHFNNVWRYFLAHPQPIGFCTNDLACGFLLNHTLSMLGGGNKGCSPSARGGMWSIFFFYSFFRGSSLYFGFGGLPFRCFGGECGGAFVDLGVFAVGSSSGDFVGNWTLTTGGT